MIDTVTVNGHVSQLFEPNTSREALSRRIDTTFHRLIEIAEALAEIAEAADASRGVATMTDPIALVGQRMDARLNVPYKYEGIMAELRGILEPPTEYSPGAHRGQLTGFNYDKLSPDHPNSMNRKYISARVFEQIDVNDQNALAKAVAGLKALGFNATAIGRDKIDFHDGTASVDVIRNSSGSSSVSRAWHWRT